MRLSGLEPFELAQ